MDFSTIGSVSSYMKGMELETKFKEKKAKGDLGPQSKKKTELEIKNEQFKAEYMRMKEKDGDEDTRLKEINNKVAADAELTSEELEYLREKDPMQYQKIKSIMDEKKSYEKRLKNCKTKEECERLKIEKANQSLSVIRSVQNDPHIPDSEKLKIAQGEMRRMNALNKVSAKFVKSGEYSKLPTEKEVLEVEKQLKEAEEAEEEKLLDTSETEKTDNASEADDKTGSEVKTDDISDEKPEITEDDKPTKAEIESSPEAQKIKHSKAKKAYDEAKDTDQSSAGNSFWKAKV